MKTCDENVAGEALAWSCTDAMPIRAKAASGKPVDEFYPAKVAAPLADVDIRPRNGKQTPALIEHVDA